MNRKRTIETRKFDSLSPENIRNAISMADAALAVNGIDFEERGRYRQLLDGMLNTYAENHRDSKFRILMFRRYKKVTVFLEVKCESFNILEEDKNTFFKHTMRDMADRPAWKYRFGKNRITFTVKTVVPGIEALKYVIHYMDSERSCFLTGFLFRVINMLLLVIEPLLAARIIVAISSSDGKKLLTVATMMALIEAGSSLVTYIASRKLTRAYTAMRDELQTDLSKKTLKIKTENIDSHSSGLFIQRIVEETGNLANGIDEMLGVFTEIVRLAALLIAFATISVRMLLFEIVLFVLYFLIVKAQAKKLNEDNRSLKIAGENLSGFVSEMVKACRDIKLLHCEDSFLLKAKDVISNNTERTRDLQNHSNTYIFAREQFVAWTNLLYLVVLMILMTKHGMTVATALVLYNYNGKAYASARGISNATEKSYSLLLSAERVYQLFRGRDFAKEEFGEEKLETVRGELGMDRVHFSFYHENVQTVPVLKGLDLHIEAGQSVALVGKSGCGKSTILSLITRLYEPQSGKVQLDGFDTAGLDRDSIRGNIGMVSQSPYLFNMSIRENFTLVKEDVTEEEIIEACKTACIHDDIMRFASGYDTVVGEGGVLLSGGQRQRIAIARCLIRDYPIIVFDEATSALDNETQELIRRAIESMQGRTVIMVAHRLTTVINCDRLFFIENGRVIAAGTHSELLENCEEYRKLYGEETGAC
ncbi:MAG: ABC transporter ATP-binding protein [Eubacteriales bacterium]|nr:ABC transporter ATP-binding protein [Eubacteriales bacterium]